MGRNLRAEIRPASPSMKGAVALYCLDLKWKQRIKVTCPHQMIDIESVGGPNRDFRRRERKGENSSTAGGRLSVSLPGAIWQTPLRAAIFYANPVSCKLSTRSRSRAVSS
jgi:hypothetical protein